MKTIVLSHDTVANTLLEELVRAGRMIATLHQSVSGSISHRYGKRFLITASNVTLPNLNHSDFVEVVDYNPVNDTALIIGRTNPSPEVPLHWLIYTRDDINAIIYLSQMRDIHAASHTSTSEFSTFNLGKEVLPLLRLNRKATLSDGTIISIGRTLNETVEALS